MISWEVSRLIKRNCSAGVALMVYFIGGCVYQRTVMHARGWRQLPHWQTWSSAFSFVWVRRLLFPASVFGHGGVTPPSGLSAPMSGILK